MAGKPLEMGPYGRRLAVNLRLLRRLRDMTTAEMSARLGEIGRPIVDTAITKTEKGTRRVDVDDLMAFAQVLGVDPMYLLADGLSSDAILGNPAAADRLASAPTRGPGGLLPVRAG